MRLTARGATTYAIANTELMGPHSLVDELVHSMVTHEPEDPRARRRGYLAADRVTDIIRDRLDDQATLTYPLYPAPGEPWPPRAPFPAR